MSVTSAGILAFRKRNNEVEVLLVHPGGPFWERKDKGSWSIPKGLFDENEEAVEAARREFREETGFKITGDALINLGELRQPGGKIIKAWAIEQDFDEKMIDSNKFTLEWPRNSGIVKEYPEVDRGEWFGIAKARQKILKGQMAFLDRLLQRIGQ